MFNDAEKEDRRFEAMFRDAKFHIADAGFSLAVTTEIRRRSWIRRLVLSAAMGLGLVIALGSMQEIIMVLSERVLDLADTQSTPLNILRVQELLQALGDKMSDIANEWQGSATLARYPIFTACVVALISPLAIRILER